MKNSLSILLIVVVAMLALSACSSDSVVDSESVAIVAGNVASGQALFESTVVGSGSSPGCITCHSLEPDLTLVGPSLAGIAGRADDAVPGSTAEEYLGASIREPNSFVSEGFAAGVMYQNYDRELSDQQVADLVAYLLTQK